MLRTTLGLPNHSKMAASDVSGFCVRSIRNHTLRRKSGGSGTDGFHEWRIFLRSSCISIEYHDSGAGTRPPPMTRLAPLHRRARGTGRTALQFGDRCSDAALMLVARGLSHWTAGLRIRGSCQTGFRLNHRTSAGLPNRSRSREETGWIAWAGQNRTGR